MDFDKLVIEKSHEIPVLVDFWAPWCAPCRTLGPIITELAEEANGKWILEKIDTDQHPELMQRFGIRGIPAVKLFYKGDVIADFTGMKPKHHIEYWLEQNLPDGRLDELDTIREDLVKLEAFVNQNDDLIEAKLALIRLLLFTSPTKCQGIIGSIPPGSRFHEEFENLKQLSGFLVWEAEDTSQVALKIKNAQSLAITKNHVQALGLLIESIMINKSFEQELARKTCIAYFNFLGRDHEVTKALRRRFDMALY
jgi:putative thioredoxin